MRGPRADPTVTPQYSPAEDRPVSQLESYAMMASASGPLAARVHKIVRFIPRPSVPEAPLGEQTRGMSRVWRMP